MSPETIYRGMVADHVRKSVAADPINGRRQVLAEVAAAEAMEVIVPACDCGECMQCLPCGCSRRHRIERARADRMVAHYHEKGCKRHLLSW